MYAGVPIPPAYSRTRAIDGAISLPILIVATFLPIEKGASGGMGDTNRRASQTIESPCFVRKDDHREFHIAKYSLYIG